MDSFVLSETLKYLYLLFAKPEELYLGKSLKEALYFFITFLTTSMESSYSEMDKNEEILDIVCEYVFKSLDVCGFETLNLRHQTIKLLFAKCT